jgi:hypothetical protein
MRRYDLHIENKKIPFVTKLDIEQYHRAETRETNLEGGQIIYQGFKKYRLNITIGLVSSETLKDINNAIDKIFFFADFFDGDEPKTIEFSSSPLAKPSPVYKNRDLNQGVYYENVSFILEEK